MSRESSVTAVDRKTIRLTAERWRHIETRHPELRGLMGDVLRAVEDPRLVVNGRFGELIAVGRFSIGGRGSSVVVVYRESGKEGFIITAYLTSDVRDLERRDRVWPSPS